MQWWRLACSIASWLGWDSCKKHSCKHWRNLWLAFRPVSQSETAHFAVRNGLFRTLKWPVLQWIVCQCVIDIYEHVVAMVSLCLSDYCFMAWSEAVFGGENIWDCNSWHEAVLIVWQCPVFLFFLFFIYKQRGKSCRMYNFAWMRCRSGHGVSRGMGKVRRRGCDIRA